MGISPCGGIEVGAGVCVLVDVCVLFLQRHYWWRCSEYAVMAENSHGRHRRAADAERTHVVLVMCRRSVRVMQTP